MENYELDDLLMKVRSWLLACFMHCKPTIHFNCKWCEDEQMQVSDISLQDAITGSILGA